MTDREAIKAVAYRQIAEDYRKKDTEMFSGADIAEWCECEAMLIDDTIAQLEQQTERNFCAHCGKRLTGDGIHTCTQPKDKQ